MNIKQLKKALPVLFKSNITPLIVGHRGIGKSESIKQYCQENNLNFIDFRLGQMSDAGDIQGLPEIDQLTKRTRFMKPNILPSSGEGILFFDEINRTTKDILQCVFQIVLDRKLGDYTLPSGWKVVCAMNPPTEDYDVLDFDDSAFLDRFCQIKLETSTKDWIEYAKTVNMSPKVIGFFQENEEFLNPSLVDFNLDVKPSKRAAEMLSNVIKNCDDDSLLNELTIGLIGIEAASSFIAHLNKKEERLTANDILDNFDNHKEVIEKYSSDENNRQDILGLICEDFNKVFEKSPTFTEKQMNNFRQFVYTIPNDLSYAFFKNICTPNKLNTGYQKGNKVVAVLDDNELFEYFKKMIDETKIANKESKNAEENINCK